MIIYLASFLEPKNFGPGRIIGIATGSKPMHVDVATQFLPFIPEEDIITRYQENKFKNPTKASRDFVLSFKKQLEDFSNSILRKSKNRDMSPQDLLPFLEGDTLASWERSGRNNYRSLVGETLKILGYEVVVN